MSQRKKEFFSNSVSRNGILTWAGISYNGKSKISFINTNLDSHKYQTTLETSFLPFFSITEKFQHDNAPAHVSTSTKKWLAEKNIACLPWPSLSPDLNVMENVWGILSRRVYSRGKQFGNKNQLISSIQREWNKLPQEDIKGLFDGMPNRIFKCISKNGQTIN